MDSLATERRTNHTLLDDTSRSRHLTGLQGVSKVFCLFYGEVTGDLAVAAGNLILYGRERIYIAVKDDSYRFADIIFGQTLPGLSTLCVHRHRYISVSAELREVGTRIGDHVSFEGSATVTLCFECYELEVGVSLVDSFYRPVETSVTRQNGFRDLRVEHSVYFCGIDIVNGTDYRTAVSLTCLVHGRVEDSEERVVLLVFCNLCSLVCLDGCAVCTQVIYQVSEVFALSLRSLLCFHLFCSLFLRSGSGELTVDLRQHRQQLGSLVGLPELKVRRTLEQFTNTLRLFDTRKLDEDTARLSKFLDVRLYHTEAVDTRTEHVERVLNSAIHFLADNFLYFFVGRGQGYFVLQLESREDRSQLSVRVHFFVRFDEKGYEISTAGFLFLASARQSLFVVRRLVVSAERIEDVRNGYLHRHVHTALEVQTEVNLFLTTLFERVTKPNFLGSNRVQILILLNCITCRILLRSLVIVAGHERERQIEGAYQRKAHRQNSNKSFVLHNCFVVF